MKGQSVSDVHHQVEVSYSPVSLSPFPKLLTTNFKVTKTSTLTIKAKDAKEKDKRE